MTENDFDEFSEKVDELFQQIATDLTTEQNDYAHTLLADPNGRNIFELRKSKPVRNGLLSIFDAFFSTIFGYNGIVIAYASPIENLLFSDKKYIDIAIVNPEDRTPKEIETIKQYADDFGKREDIRVDYI